MITKGAYRKDFTRLGTSTCRGILFAALCCLATLSGSCRKDTPTRTESCEQFAKRRVRSLPFDELIRRGARCLSPEDEATLGRAQTQVLVGISEEETVEQLIASQKKLEIDSQSFELPSIPPSEPTTEHAVSNSPTAPINPNVHRSPVFIYDAEANGSPNKEHPTATGFFVGVPASGNRLLRLFVTARHVINRTWAGCQEKNPAEIYLRFNQKSDKSNSKAPGVAYVRLETSSFYQPDDDALDLAVAIVSPSMMPDWDSYDTAPIWMSLFATDEELHSLAKGDQVYTSGLVPSSAGVKENRTSFTYATISDLSIEPSKSFCERESDPKSLRVWELTPQLNAGRSGSPIFKTENRFINVARRSGPVLIGVQSMANKDGGQSGISSAADLCKTIESATRTLSGLDFRRGFH
jgi:hypothetical protein